MAKIDRMIGCEAATDFGKRCSRSMRFMTLDPERSDFIQPHEAEAAATAAVAAAAAAGSDVVVVDKRPIAKPGTEYRSHVSCRKYCLDNCAVWAGDMLVRRPLEGVVQSGPDEVWSVTFHSGEINFYHPNGYSSWSDKSYCKIKWLPSQDLWQWRQVLGRRRTHNEIKRDFELHGTEVFQPEVVEGADLELLPVLCKAIRGRALKKMDLSCDMRLASDVQLTSSQRNNMRLVKLAEMSHPGAFAWTNHGGWAMRVEFLKARPKKDAPLEIEYVYRIILRSSQQFDVPADYVEPPVVVAEKKNVAAAAAAAAEQNETTTAGHKRKRKHIILDDEDEDEEGGGPNFVARRRKELAEQMNAQIAEEIKARAMETNQLDQKVKSLSRKQLMAVAARYKLRFGFNAAISSDRVFLELQRLPEPISKLLRGITEIEEEVQDEEEEEQKEQKENREAQQDEEEEEEEDEEEEEEEEEDSDGSNGSDRPRGRDLSRLKWRKPKFTDTHHQQGAEERGDVEMATVSKKTRAILASLGTKRLVRLLESIGVAFSDDASKERLRAMVEEELELETLSASDVLRAYKEQSKRHNVVFDRQVSEFEKMNAGALGWHLDSQEKVRKQYLASASSKTVAQQREWLQQELTRVAQNPDLGADISQRDNDLTVARARVFSMPRDAALAGSETAQDLKKVSDLWDQLAALGTPRTDILTKLADQYRRLRNTLMRRRREKIKKQQKTVAAAAASSQPQDNEELDEDEDEDMDEEDRPIMF